MIIRMTFHMITITMTINIKHTAMKKAMFLLTVIIAFTGCGNRRQPVGHTHGPGGSHPGYKSEDGATIPTLSYTLFSDGLELFVEFPALVVGQISTFAAHFTRLETYEPVSGGQLTVGIVKEGKGIRHSVDSPSSPGIFRPALQPKEPGMYTMFFELNSTGGIARFEIRDTEVFPDPASAIASTPGSDHADAITFLKEQAWKTDFNTAEIIPQPFYSIIHTSGKVKSPPRAEVVLNAPADGQITIFNIPGESVEAGAILALVSGMGLESDLNIKFNGIRIAYEKSRLDYLRTRSLSENQVISEKVFLEIRTRYLQDSLLYYQYADRVSDGGLKVMAPMSGFVSRVMVENGESVQTGDPVLAITRNDQLLVEAYVNQSDHNGIEGIFDAHFRLPAGDSTITLLDLEGTIRSRNAFVHATTTRIPVTFSVNNSGALIPGMFLEVFLLTGRKERALVAPLSAIIEEQGNYYVFVQSGGESFIKRQVEIAGNDGIRAEIESGIRPGDRIVARGAMQIRLAAMAGDLPLHGHTH